MEVSEIIAQIANELDCFYLRATDEDANIRVEDLDLQNLPLVVYNNLPIVEGVLGNTHQQLYPLEIKVLKLGDPDDNTVNIDTLLNECRVIATKLVLKLIPYSAYPPEGYDLDTLNSVMIYDANMTGVSVNIEFVQNVVC